MFILRSEAEMLVVKLNMKKEIANKMAEDLKCLSIAFVIHLICVDKVGKNMKSAEQQCNKLLQ